MRRWRGRVVLGAAALAALAAFIFAWAWLRAPAVVRALPPGNAFAYFNLVPLRQAGLLAMGGVVPRSPNYAAFVRDSGFDFERDLDALAISLNGPLDRPTDATAALQGRFSGQFLDYLRHNALHTTGIGDRTGYVFPGWTRPDQPLTVIPLDPNHLIVTNARDPSAALAHGGTPWRRWLVRPLAYASAGGGLATFAPALQTASAQLRLRGDSLDAQADLDAATTAEAAQYLDEIEQQAQAIAGLHGSGTHFDARLDGNHIHLELHLPVAALAALTAPAAHP